MLLAITALLSLWPANVAWASRPWPEYGPPPVEGGWLVPPGQAGRSIAVLGNELKPLRVSSASSVTPWCIRASTAFAVLSSRPWSEPKPLRFQTSPRPGVLVGLTEPRRMQNGHGLGAQIVVRTQSPQGWKEAWRHGGLNPWKLTVADVDGDGSKEVVVGVYKKSRFDPVMEKRVFVYEWTGRLLKPKWLGSKLSRRFDDFTFAESGGKTELLALERGPEHSKRISVYEWNGFGFKWIACTEAFAGLSGFETANGVPIVNGGGRTYSVSVDANRIELKRKEP